MKAWPPVVASRGAGAQSALHSHHALHFVLAVEGELKVRTSARAPWSAAAGVLTSADVSHAIDARGLEVLLVFFDPESAAGMAFAPALSGGVRLISAAERTALLRELDPGLMVRAGADDWIARAAHALGVLQPGTRRTLHPRVRRLLAALRTSGIDGPHSLDALAGQIGLSPGRLMHVFTDSVGIPLRPYLAWLRVQYAAGAIVSGASLTEAAHAAGFSDAAHMTRTFTRMLGVAPSGLRPSRA